MRLTAAILACAFSLSAGRARCETPIGFGARTTGGAAGAVCQWRDAQSLQRCVAGDAPTIARAVGNPTVIVTRTIQLGANKSVVGPAILTGLPYLLMDHDKSNIVIQNIQFVTAPGGVNKAGQACPDVTQPATMQPKDTIGCGGGIAIIARGADVTRIWIDHDGFARCGDKCVAMSAVTGPLAAPNILRSTGHLPKLDEVTVSNSRFSDSYFGMLVGVSGGEQVPQEAGHERVTVYGNTFEHIYRRSPRAAFGAWVHLWNNKIIGWDDARSCNGRAAGFGASVNGQAQLLSQNNIFDTGNPALPAACRMAISSTEAAKDGVDSGYGYFVDIGSVFAHGALTSPPSPRAKVFTPPYSTAR